MIADVSVVIPVYNRSTQLARLLRSLKEAEPRPSEVIIVDNGSTDGIAHVASIHFPEAKIISLDSNYGAARARNVGLWQARCQYVLFVDSDNVVDGTILPPLIAALESDPNVAVVGPKTYYFEDPRRIWYAGATISLVTMKTTYRGLNEIDVGQFDEPIDTGHVPNCWMMRKLQAVESGGIDESYVMSYAEADWPERLRARGFRTRYVPGAVTYHDVPPPGRSGAALRLLGFESPRRAYYFGRNRGIFCLRHAGRMQRIFFFCVLYPVFSAYYVLACLYHGQPSMTTAYLTGVLNAYQILFSSDIIDCGAAFSTSAI